MVFNCIYGIEANALSDKDSPFLNVARRVFVTSPLKLLYITLKSVFPSIFQFYDLPFIPKDIQSFFVGLTDSAIKLREHSDERREDYLHFLLQLQEKKHLQLDDMAAHTITFFLDGYETSSIVLSHALYQLAKYKSCQQKLRDEICTYNEHISYETVTDMPYLDQVLNGK